MTADPQHDQRANAVDDVHHRPDEAAHPRQPHVGLLEAAVQLVEVLDLVLLRSVRLDDVDAGAKLPAHHHQCAVQQLVDIDELNRRAIELRVLLRPVHERRDPIGGV